MSEAQPLDPSAAQPPKGALSIIFFIVFMDLLGFGIIIPLLPLFAKQYRATALDVGLLFSIYSGCQFIAAPILGAISDRFGRRPVLVFSQLGSSLGYLLLGIVMNLHWFHPFYALLLIYCSRFIDGISGGNISTAQAYISDVTTPQNRARGMGVIGAAFGVGFALGPALGALLVLVHPALPGYFAAAMSFGAMLQTYFRLPESRVHKPATSSQWLHPSRFVPIFRHARLVQLLLIAFISMAAFVMLESMVALFLSSDQTFRFRDWQVGLYYAYLGVIIAIVQGGFIGRLTKRLGEWPLAIAGPILVGVGMGMLAVVGFKPILLILILGGGINAIGRSLQTPTLYALISHNSDQKEQGLVFGLNQGLGSIARVIGPIVAAAVYRIHVSGPFILGGAIVLLAALWTLALRMKSGGSAPFPLPADASAAESV
ncbi:MAG TPA: MFS transporter [Tepidisphaeraceae bacterium]|jgi:DHA1 family tetracycline resistance protein-like MFS transporter|nr:MFS transporter [Tepidisphaeraceae bacterium]